MQGVALTSLWIAAVRALESESSEPLFSDPFARQLAGPEGFEVVRTLAVNSPPITPPTLQVRTRFMDDGMSAAVAGGIRQIVSLAAGMDARAFRLDGLGETTYFEVDHPEVLAYKAEKLAGVSPRCDRRAVSIDLRGDWPAALLSAGFEAKVPTLWIVEGLLPYLIAPEVTALLARVNELCVAKSVMLFDCFTVAVLDAPALKFMTDFVARLGAPWRFGCDRPEDLLEPLGWDVHGEDMAVVAQRWDRWPFPIAPRGTPGVPQSILLKAVKR